ncbi:MAG: hypothetical protein IIY45_09850 [Firmicutes bacterium]|nr:hypothetical protein [Bacillota bacterium]
MPRNNTARKQPQQDWLAASLAEKMPADLESAQSESVLPGKEKKDEIVYEEMAKPVNRTKGVLAGLFSFLFVVGFLGACFYQTISLKNELDTLETQKIQLEREIEEAKTEALLNKIDQSYINSDQYREDMARNRFRLLFPGEYLIQIE